MTELPTADPYIFVSYSAEDYPGAGLDPFVRDVLEYLHATISRRFAPWRLWWDKKELVSGGSWHDQIRPAIARSSAGLLLISDAWLDKEYVREHEYPALLQRHKQYSNPLFWFLIEPTDPEQLRAKCAELFGLGSPQSLNRDPMVSLYERGPGRHAATRSDVKSHLSEIVQSLNRPLGSLHRTEADQIDRSRVDDAGSRDSAPPRSRPTGPPPVANRAVLFSRSRPDLPEETRHSRSPSVTAGGRGPATSAVSSKQNYVVLLETGSKKILVIKTIREMTGISLLEANNLTETTPAIVQSTDNRREALDHADRLRRAGAKAVVRTRPDIDPR